MRGKTKKDKNPYLIVLLKGMLKYEFLTLHGDQSDLRVADNVFQHYATGEYKQYRFKSAEAPKDTFAYSQARRIYREFLLAPDFAFTNKFLDLIVQELNRFGTFSNWQAFLNEFENDPGAVYAAENYLYDSYPKLKEKEKEDIAFWSLAKLVRLVEKRHRINYRYDHIVFADTAEHMVRTADPDDLSELKFLKAIGKKLSPNEKQFHQERIAKIVKRNDCSIIVYKDDIQIKAYIVSLPISVFTFDQINTGRLALENINATDVLPTFDDEKVRYIFIPYSQASSRVTKVFCFYLKDILSSLSGQRMVPFLRIFSLDLDERLDFLWRRKVGRIKDNGYDRDIGEVEWQVGHEHTISNLAIEDQKHYS